MVVGESPKSFHSTKEGFKVRGHLADGDDELSFHSTKEGFKAGSSAYQVYARSLVSIPLRKVSRELIPPFDPLKIASFHSTKEGFKVRVVI